MKFRIDLAITIDIEADDVTAAEIEAIKNLNVPGLKVVNVICLDNQGQGELFDERE